jgi:hypothetical protein
LEAFNHLIIENTNMPVLDVPGTLNIGLAVGGPFTESQISYGSVINA